MYMDRRCGAAGINMRQCERGHISAGATEPQITAAIAVPRWRETHSNIFCCSNVSVCEPRKCSLVVKHTPNGLVGTAVTHHGQRNEPAAAVERSRISSRILTRAQSRC